MLIVGRPDVERALAGRETQILETVERVYVAHARGETVVPHSLFLRFPHDERSRIIALPAYLGGGSAVAGIKWISSFPGNHARGLERASAALILNSLETGQPEALVEASVVSARRTAASAALAGRLLTGGSDVRGVTLVGCGVINREILRFLRVCFAGLERVTVFDTDRERAERFAASAELPAEVADTIDEALAAHPLVSFATTAARPHTGAGGCRPGTVVLHVSLRDLTVEAILDAVNVVDDADHVCREGTSLDLAQQAVGHRGFIHAEIGRLLAGVRYELDRERVTVFSPFGLGALDLAVADLVRRVADELELGTRIDDFLAAAPTGRAA